MRELGERGITLGATFPLAFDPDTKVGEEFRTLSGLMSLAVGMAYVVDASGKILWREQFSRGAAPANQLEFHEEKRPTGDNDESHPGYPSPIPSCTGTKYIMRLRSLLRWTPAKKRGLRPP